MLSLQNQEKFELCNLIALILRVTPMAEVSNKLQLQAFGKTVLKIVLGIRLLSTDIVLLMML